MLSIQPETYALENLLSDPGRCQALWASGVQLPNHRITSYAFVASDGITLLSPVDPLMILLQFRGMIDRLRTALGSDELFNYHVLPALFSYAALVQSLPRDAHGLFSKDYGLVHSGLAFAHGALMALEQHVIAPDLAPIARALWSDRLRTAVLLAGLMSDADKLNHLRLDVGVMDERDNRFIPKATWHPALETLFEFGLKHMGETVRLWRLSPDERTRFVHANNTDTFQRVINKNTERWLASCEREGGESVLMALKTSVFFGVGDTTTSKLIAESVAYGRAYALNAREREVAAREGRHKVLRAYAEVFAYTLRALIMNGNWLPNRQSSPLIWSEDGVWLKWPTTLIRMNQTLRENRAQCQLIDEPTLVSSLLAQAGLLVMDSTSAVVYSLKDTPIGDFEAVKLCDSASFVRLIEVTRHRLADKTEPYPPLMQKTATLVGETQTFETFELNVEAFDNLLVMRGDVDAKIPAMEDPAWNGEVEEEQSKPFMKRFEAFLNRLLTKKDISLYGTEKGLFIPSAFLSTPEETAQRLDDYGLLVRRTVKAGLTDALRTERSSIWWKAFVSDAGPGKTCNTHSVNRTEEGICLVPLLFRPVRLIGEDAVLERRWMPEGGFVRTFKKMDRQR